MAKTTKEQSGKTYFTLTCELKQTRGGTTLATHLHTCIVCIRSHLLALGSLLNNWASRNEYCEK